MPIASKVALFVPCFVDQLAPEVAVAATRVLRRVGYEVQFPHDQTCCGQPAYNAGFWNDATPCADRFVRVFSRFEHIVCPSGSCTAMVRNAYPRLLAESPAAQEAESVAKRVYEFSEFLVRVAGVVDVGASFPHKTTFHPSCHASRELGVVNEPLTLLRNVRGLELLDLPDRGECCGFGGTFATKFAVISASMGRSKCDRIVESGAEYYAAIDSSCLLHIDGVMRKSGLFPKPIHLAQILASTGARS